MKSVYKDPNITLRNMRMIQFDPSHDVPTLIEMLARRPAFLDIQDRTLIARAIAFVNARKNARTMVLVGISSLTVLSTALVFMFGNESRDRRLLTLPATEGVADNPLAADLLAKLHDKDVMQDLSLLVATAAESKDFLVALLPASAKDDVRSVIDLLVNGRAGVLLIKDYGLNNQPGHLEYCRDRGLRIVQLPDGSAELWNLNF